MNWRWRKSREADLGQEIQSHLDAEIEEQEARGVPREEARFSAQKTLGNTALIQENTRAAWGWTSIEILSQDLRYALRLLRKNPVFTVTAVLSLAIGIGINTSIFSLLDEVLLRNLPVRAPENLVLMAEKSGARQNFSFSTPQFRALARNDTLEGLAAFRPWRFKTATRGEAHFVNGQLVSGNWLSIVGVRPFLGRTLTEQDDRSPGGNPVAFLHYHYWQREFGADPNVIGRSIELQGHLLTIVGVAQPKFEGLEPGKEVDITVPLGLQPLLMPGTPLLDSAEAQWVRLIGRRKPGVTISQVQANLASHWTRLHLGTQLHPGVEDSLIEILPGGQGLYDLRHEFSLPLRLLMGAGALVLLVACANLASLLLARATSRRQEIALRLSLGASRGRLLRQLLTESMLLSMMGGIFGIAFALWGGPLLVALMSRGHAPIVLDLAIHTRTLVFTAMVTLATGLLFGIGPALRSTSSDSLHASRLIAGRPSRWTAALIVSQVSLSMVVLACAGLMLGSLRKLRQVDAGFRPDHVLLMSIRPELSGYGGSRAARLYQDLQRRFSALPGVRSVTLSMDTPLGGVSYTAGASRPGSSNATEASVNSVGPRFFETMGIPFRMGRDLTARDNDHTASVAVVSESVASRLFPGGNPLGERITIGGSSLEIVGVAKDTRYQSLRAPAQPMVYRPYLQMPDFWEELFFGIRTVGDPESILPEVRRELHETAPNVPAFSLSTLDEQVDATLVQERMVSTLSACFGIFALVLAAIGLYGRLDYAVVERTREIGIRLALGAPRPSVCWTILREVLALVVGGVAIGLPLAMASARAIQSLLYGLQPFDPFTLTAVVFTLVAVAAMAGYIPAHRAAHVDPMEALRHE
jgi:putative ABC transport system permease protein